VPKSVKKDRGPVTEKLVFVPLPKKAIHELPAPRAGGSLEPPALLAPMAKPALSMMRRSRFILLRQARGLQPKSQPC
jgi:hypothetical protein